MIHDEELKKLYSKLYLINRSDNKEVMINSSGS